MQKIEEIEKRLSAIEAGPSKETLTLLNKAVISTANKVMSQSKDHQKPRR